MITMTFSISWGTIPLINLIFKRREVYSQHLKEKGIWVKHQTNVKDHVMIESLGRLQVAEDSKSPPESIQEDQVFLRICIKACTRARAKTPWLPIKATFCWIASLFNFLIRKFKEAASPKPKDLEETAQEILMIHTESLHDHHLEASSLETYSRIPHPIKQKRPKMILLLLWRPRAMPQLLVHKWIN